MAREKRHTIQELQELQALPLDLKIRLTKQRIREWIRYYGDNGVYVSFSGGKDSTVLLDIVRDDYPNVVAMFVDVPTQYPELRDFVKTFDNVDIVKPKISFMEVCKKYGFPLISKEVSESVQGARKYLTSLLKSESVLTDRQTDRIPYRYCYERVTGTGNYRTKANTPNSRLLEEIHMQSIRGGNDTHTILNATDSLERLANILNERMVNKKGGANQRLAIILGMLTKDKNNPIKANIPSEDRSMFSMEKYKFFLDAPFEISNKCCDVMKKNPAHKYHKDTGRVPITAQMASESRLRTQKWLEHSCNGFDLKIPTSNPMSFWTEQDVLLYIKIHHDELIIRRKEEYAKVFKDEGLRLTDYVTDIVNGVEKKVMVKDIIDTTIISPICSVYGDVVTDDEEWGQMDFAQWTGLEEFEIGNKPLHCTGCDRTGCCLCGFGAHLGNDERFIRLKETHPGMYSLLDKVENNGYTYRQAIEWVNEHGNLNIRL